MRKIILTGLISVFLFACGGISEKKKKLNELAESANELKEQTEKLVDEVEKKGLEEISEIASDGNSSGNLPEHYDYKADNLWKNAVENFEKSKAKMPTKGVQTEIVVGVKDGKADSSITKLHGSFLYRGNKISIVPEKIVKKGEIQEVEQKKIDPKKYKSNLWFPNYTTKDSCVMTVLRKDYQEKIGVIPTGEEHEIEGKTTILYKVSAVSANGEIIPGKVYIDKATANPAKVDFTLESEKGYATGGIIYTFTNEGLVKFYKAFVILKVMGNQTERITEVDFTEHGEVTVY